MATDSAPPGVEERLRKAEAAVTLLEGAVETERASGKAGWDKVEALERSLAELRIQVWKHWADGAAGMRAGAVVRALNAPYSSCGCVALARTEIH